MLLKERAPRPDCAIPKILSWSKVVCQHQNAGSKMRTFSESWGNMPIGTKTGSEFRVHFEAASHSFLN